LSFKILLHPKAAHFLRKAEPTVKNRIKDRLRELQDTPEKGERLNPPFRRLRIGDYRAIYEVDRDKRRAIILFIGHRREVYDDFSRLL